MEFWYAQTAFSIIYGDGISSRQNLAIRTIRRPCVHTFHWYLHHHAQTNWVGCEVLSEMAYPGDKLGLNGTFYKDSRKRHNATHIRIYHIWIQYIQKYVMTNLFNSKISHLIILNFYFVDIVLCQFPDEFSVQMCQPRRLLQTITHSFELASPKRPNMTL